jgi:hypothetical protein
MTQDNNNDDHQHQKQAPGGNIPKKTSTSPPKNNNKCARTVAVAVVMLLLMINMDLTTTYLSIQQQSTSAEDSEYQRPHWMAGQALTATGIGNQTGEWVGDNWIPPKPWTVFSPSEMRELYQDHSLLWIGDSTARRASTTLYGLLKHEKTDGNLYVRTNEIDGSAITEVNKLSTTETCIKFGEESKHPLNFCRPMPHFPTTTTLDDRDFGYISSACTRQLEPLFTDEADRTSNLTGSFDLVVIAQGIWEGVRNWDCRETNRTSLEILQSTFDAFDLLLSSRPNVTFIFRSSGFDGRKRGMNQIYEFNNYAQTRIQNYTQLQYKAGLHTNAIFVDWARIIESRSFGKDRIEGDLLPHYGLGARDSLLQMIANSFADHKKRRNGASRSYLNH